MRVSLLSLILLQMHLRISTAANQNQACGPCWRIGYRDLQPRDQRNQSTLLSALPKVFNQRDASFQFYCQFNAKSSAILSFMINLFTFKIAAQYFFWDLFLFSFYILSGSLWFLMVYPYMWTRRGTNHKRMRETLGNVSKQSITTFRLVLDL